MDSASPPPGCLLALVSLAGPMAADVATPLGEVPASYAARYVLDLLMDGLVTAGPYAKNLEIGVYGYRGTPGGLAFEWLLPTPEPTGALAGFDTLIGAEVPCRAEGQPRKWVRGAEAEGTPEPAAALARAHRVLAWWAARHPDGRPPVFVHCATADGVDSHAGAVVRGIRALAVPSGPTRVLEWTFAPGADAGFPSDDVWAMLFDDAEVRTVGGPSTGPAFAVERVFWSQKRGNEPGMWEDAYAVGPCGTIAAICDGASDGIFCRDWAARMADRFVVDRPDLSNRAAVGTWVAAARRDWQAAINYPKLRWSQQNKVNETGASATLIGLEVGPPGPTGDRPWRATAIGDACLIHTRAAQEWLAFPLVAVEQFTSAPSLLRTKLGATAPPATFATGTCRVGDLFLLATDAVAGKLLADAAAGHVNWEDYAAMSTDAWLTEFDDLRDAGKMVNDDCTLLALRVLPASPVDPNSTTEHYSTQDVVILAPSGEHIDAGRS
jgi:hypothetical protein